MTQLNLLPDVKLEYIKAQRSRRLAVSISLLVCAGAIALLVLLLAATGLQKKHMSDLSKDITADSAKLAKKPQVTKILTVQNQLESLTPLHSAKPAASRVFSYLNEVTPPQVSITNFKIDFTSQTVTITGTADTLSSVNKYIDTLKFTTFKAAGEDSSAPAFNNVVMTSFGLSSTSQVAGQPATYTITLNYDPAIFDITKEVALTVPNRTTTRSATQSNQLFQPAPVEPSANEGGN